MLFRADDPRHHYATERPRHRLDGIHLQPGHGDLVAQFLAGQRRVHPLAQPLFTNFHCIYSARRLELLEKAQVIIKKQAQVVDPIAQHGQPLHPHAEGEARIYFRVYTG